ncbi:MAG: hypothetical protein AAF363_08610 [Bacteroidota bacterium]
MKNVIFTLSIIILFLGCEKPLKEQHIPVHIGLIEYDAKKDTLGFEVCHEDLLSPYFHHLNISYEGEKPAMVKEYKNRFKPSDSLENGFITIRFIVNCKGKAGRFRVIQIDEHYNLKTFSDETVMQLYHITRSLKGWDIFERNHESYDYIRYVTFKIHNGEIKDIMP